MIEIADRVETMMAVNSATVCSHGLISAGTILRNIPAIGAPMPYKNFVPRSVWSKGFILVLQLWCVRFLKYEMILV